jgi:hypothetical protein
VGPAASRRGVIRAAGTLATTAVQREAVSLPRGMQRNSHGQELNAISVRPTLQL